MTRIFRAIDSKSSLIFLDLSGNQLMAPKASRKGKEKTLAESFGTKALLSAVHSVSDAIFSFPIQIPVEEVKRSSVADKRKKFPRRYLSSSRKRKGIKCNAKVTAEEDGQGRLAHPIIIDAPGKGKTKSTQAKKSGFAGVRELFSSLKEAAKKGKYLKEIKLIKTGLTAPSIKQLHSIFTVKEVAQQKPSKDSTENTPVVPKDDGNRDMYNERKSIVIDVAINALEENESCSYQNRIEAVL